MRTLDGPVEVGVQLDTSVQNLDFGVAPRGLFRVTGTARLDGTPIEDLGLKSNNAIRAFIGGVDCTVTTSAIPPPHSANGSFIMSVAMAGVKAGCGEVGATVRFTIGGRPANETLQVQTFDVGQPEMRLTAGAPFALYKGVFAETDESRAPVLEGTNYALAAFVNGTLCSSVSGLNYSFEVVVFSAEARPGCAVVGSKVELRLDGRPLTPVLTWSEGVHEIDLWQFSNADVPTLAPTPRPTVPGTSITPPAAGDGGLTTRR